MEKIYRTGIGYDVHRLVEGRKCVIGGVHIPFEMGLLGHSDADVLIHAIADAILGAMGLGDIGTFFPDTDPSLEGMDSITILEFIQKTMEEKNITLISIDSVVMAEVPKINPHREAMQQRLAGALNVSVSQIGIKATTTEKLGFVGRKEGIAAQAVATVVVPFL
ncbi:MAG: 2-C-methyl-D-erythritol 2,4-cyclodiphosphate synthase [Fibrobacterales bacterium]